MDVHPVDVLIVGARVVDGTGNPWFYGDVALSGDHVRAVAPPGSIPPENAGEVVDATGRVVCPGFIDVQSHSILPLMRDPRCLSKITQGVTTEIMGEGWTPAPSGGRILDPDEPFRQNHLLQWGERARGWKRFRDWLETMAAEGVTPNVGSFLGGGTLREYAKGMDLGPATPDERAMMQRVARAAMEDGAFGVSYALVYPPDAFASADEITSVCAAIAPFGGIYITHLRSEADGFLEALDEAFQIGRRGGVAVEIYHLKAAGRRNWGKMSEAILRIERARATGLDVTADMYPYVGAGTGLASVLPPWLAAEGKFYENLRDPIVRARARAAALRPSGDWEPFGDLAGPEGVMPVSFQKPENRPYTGRRLSDIAAERGQDWLDAAIDLLVSEEQRIFTVYFMMSEENLRLQLQQPWMKISTDAGGIDPAWAAERGPTHPRAYGTYPRVLGRYALQDGVLTLEDAVRKMSGAVADRLRLRDRGQLRAGFWADVVVFDPATVRDRATFEDPHQLSSGILDVWVNGVRVLRDGAHTGAKPGRFVHP